MSERYLVTTCAVALSLTLLGTVSYGQDKPIKKDLKVTSISKNINNPYMVIQSGGAMDAYAAAQLASGMTNVG